VRNENGRWAKNRDIEKKAEERGKVKISKALCLW
jgi:hypothetical protein